MYTIIESKMELELVDYTEGTSGGFKSIIFNVIGVGAYGLKYEGGVHRVQRVLRQKHKVEFIPLHRLLLFCQKQKSLMWS